MGWYPTGTNPDGSSCAPSCGGRLMLHVGPLSGSRQATCPHGHDAERPELRHDRVQLDDRATRSPFRPRGRPAHYIVKLKRPDGTAARELHDLRRARRLQHGADRLLARRHDVAGLQLLGRRRQQQRRLQTSTAASTTSRATTLGPRALHGLVRPAVPDGRRSTDGAGHFFDWDFPMIRCMESQGYDMTYVTSVDLETNPSLLIGHRVFVNTGHDEYYSDNMRTNIQNAIANGRGHGALQREQLLLTGSPGPRTEPAPRTAGSTATRTRCPARRTFEWRLLSPRSVPRTRSAA